MARKSRKRNSGQPQEKTSKKAASQLLGLHHICPTSRGGVNDVSNIYPRERWNPYNEKHEAWHVLFANLIPEETCMLIELWTRKDGGLDLRYFGSRKGKPNKRIISWKTLFADKTPKEAVELITREFIRKEWLQP